MNYKVNLTTVLPQQGVQFKVNVSKSKFGENFQFVQGLRESETDTHITVQNGWRALRLGTLVPQFRTYKKSRIVSGISRMNF